MKFWFCWKEAYSGMKIASKPCHEGDFWKCHEILCSLMQIRWILENNCNIVINSYMNTWVQWKDFQRCDEIKAKKCQKIQKKCQKKSWKIVSPSYLDSTDHYDNPFMRRKTIHCRNEKCEFGGVQMTSCIEGQRRIAYHKMRQSIQHKKLNNLGEGP